MMDQLASHCLASRPRPPATRPIDGRHRWRLLALFLLATFALSIPSGAYAQADSYDAAAQFSLSANPNGVWTYGWSTSSNGRFTPFSKSATAPLQAGGGAVSYWNTGVPGADFHAVFANRTQQPVTVSEGTVVQPGALVLHPGKENRMAVVRFTAPADGQYAVSAIFRNLDAQAKSTRPVLSTNGVALLRQYLGGVNQKSTYNKTFLLRKGDFVDFAADNAGDKGDTYQDDAVELTLRIDRTTGIAAPQLSGGPEGPLTDQDATTTGEIRLIVAFVDFADAPGDEEASFGAIWDGIEGRGALSEMFNKQSAGKAKLSATLVKAWRRMPQPLSYYFPPGGSGWKWNEYIDNAANLYNDQRPVTNGTVMVVVPPKDAKGFTAVSGAHQLGGATGWWGMRRVITLAPGIYNEHYTTLAHELGHSFGLDELYPAAAPLSHEVAGYDLMGDVVYATGFMGWHRHKFLWMENARKAFLPRQGNYIVPLRRLSDEDGVNMVIVPDKGASATKPAKVWVVEVNQDVVTRQDYLAGNGKKLVSEGSGILIYTVETPAKPGKREIRLVQPGLEKNWKNLQLDHKPALYPQGAVFDQAQSPIKVTVWGKNEAGFVLEIIVRTTAK